MRVQLSDSALMESLLEFLRARGCIVEQLGAGVLAVWCPPAGCEGSESGMSCRSCGAPVAETLRRLGSLRCHDCRDEGGFETLLAGIYGHANSNGRAATARGDLAMYLDDWHAVHLHPGAVASVID